MTTTDHDEQKTAEQIEAEELAELVEEYGPAFEAYAEHMGGPVTGSDFENAYHGSWASEREYAESLAEDLGLFPDYSKEYPNPLIHHIAWQSWSDELFNYDYFSIDDGCGGVWVFSNN